MSDNVFSVVKTTYDKIVSGIVPIINGQMIFATDTEQIFFDYDGERKYYAYPVLKTTEEWKSNLTYIPPKGQILVYTDYYSIEDDNGDIVYKPAFKVGDGLAYGIDLPVISNDFDLAEKVYSHIANNEIHITNKERDFWNNKVRCYTDSDDPDNIVFTVN